MTAFVKRSLIFGVIAVGLLAAGMEWFVRVVEYRGRTYSPRAQTITAKERAETMAQLKAIESAAAARLAQLERSPWLPVADLPWSRLDAPGPGYREQLQRSFGP